MTMTTGLTLTSGWRNKMTTSTPIERAASVKETMKVTELVTSAHGMTPIERGAEVLWGNACLPADLRPLYRDKARAVFASIDVDELSDMLRVADCGPAGDHGAMTLATSVRDYLLGGE